MKKFTLIEFNLEYLDDLQKIANENPKITFGDALEILAKLRQDALNEIGVLNNDGTFTKSEITMEGVETKEFNFEEEINKLIDKSNP